MSSISAIPPKLKLIASATANNSATVLLEDFSDKSVAIITVSKLKPVTDNTNLLMRVKSAGVIQTGALYAGGKLLTNASLAIVANSMGSLATSFTIVPNLGINVNETWSGVLTFIRPDDANPSGYNFVISDAWLNQFPDYGFGNGGGQWRNTGTIQGAEFRMSAGNISEGEFQLWGF